MGCQYCGYSIGHAPWCPGPRGSAINASKDTMGHYEAYELSDGKAVPKETVPPAEAALHREISRLQSALAAEQKRREEAEADAARLRDVLESVLPDESGRHGGPLIQMVASYEDGTSCNDGYQQEGHKYKINHHDYTRARAALAQKPEGGAE